MLSTPAAVVGNFYDLPKELVCRSLARRFEPVANTPEEFGARIKAEIPR
jgi:hypothetical protein